jgi:hypothetical protein
MLTIRYYLPYLPYPSLITVAQGITKDFNLERGSRQSTQLEDILDDSDPDAQEAFRQEVNLRISCPVYPLHVLYIHFISCISTPCPVRRLNNRNALNLLVSES